MWSSRSDRRLWIIGIRFQGSVCVLFLVRNANPVAECLSPLNFGDLLKALDPFGRHELSAHVALGDKAEVVIQFGQFNQISGQ